MSKTGAKSGLLEEYMAERAANPQRGPRRSSARTDPASSAVKLLEEEEEDEEVPFEKVVMDFDEEERLLEKSFNVRTFPKSMKGKFWKIMQYFAAALIFWILMKLAMEKKKETWKYLKHNTDLDEDEKIMLCEDKGDMENCKYMCENAKQHVDMKRRWCDFYCDALDDSGENPDATAERKRLSCRPKPTPPPPTTAAPADLS
mmetsp:Transcript_21339/g.39037  ORF Transcript_21339/g.39037 Transcript_21339/m.39037 type:complete len:202 (+) Transcript_21339:106-711(+)